MREKWHLFATGILAGALLVAATAFALGKLPLWREGDDATPSPRVQDSATPGNTAPDESTPRRKQTKPRASRAPRPRRTRTPAPRPTETQPPPAPSGYTFPIADCQVSYSADHHNYPATDIFADAGCAFVAPVSGLIDEVGDVDRWTRAENRGADRGGLFVSIVGTDGVRYYGSHLSAIAPGVRSGVEVTAGTRLGSIGETGSAAGTGAHLHFGISWPGPNGQWWVRRGVVSPAPFLNAWRSGQDSSPAPQVTQAEQERGDELQRCQQYC